MTPAIDLQREDFAILLAVLRATLPPGTGVWVFGSRTTGSARRYSDLDLALKADTALGLDVLGRVQHALSDSDLTIKVDLVDLRSVDPDFLRLIEAEMVALPLDAG